MAETLKTQQEEAHHEQRQEAIRLKTQAESKYNSSNLKSALKYATKAHRLCPSLSGLSEMLTAFRILHSSSKTLNPRNPRNPENPNAFPSPEFYDILGLDPFSPLNSIKAQYKKLALLLHPDKNTLKKASDEAFKLVNDAFQVLSDRVSRKQYDTKLRLALQSSAAAAEAEERENEEPPLVETFWTSCSKCRLLHKFERKYVGHSLVCPNCNLSFEAVEVDDDGEEGNSVIDEENVGVRRSVRVRVKKAVFGEKGLNSKKGSLSDEERSKKGGEKGVLGMKLVNLKPKRKMCSVSEVLGREKSRRVEVPIVEEGRSEVISEKSRELEKTRSKNDTRKKARPKEVEEVVERELTLAEMKLLALRKLKGKKDDGKKAKIREESEEDKKKKRRRMMVETGDMEVMAVEDSDFYDFDKDRVERSFKKGQVWAIYDDDDGMPRHYGLIDDVVSVNPFEVKINWLDLQNDGDEQLLCYEKTGFRISCGRFKVAKMDTINLLNIFSHVVECERAAKELYRIYPKKGSIWALYSEKALDAEGRDSSSRDRRQYDIVVFLTSYSELHGLSMAYLEKVNGFRAVFKRREIGYHAIRRFEKDEIRLFSHQIPARKLSKDEAPDVSGDYWELDPASLPPDLLTITGEN